MTGKLKRVEAHLRATLPRIAKMAIGGGVRVKPRTTFPLPRRENIPKRKYSSSSSSATSTTSDSDSSDNKPAIKRLKVVPEDKWYKYKISKSMASFANENFNLNLGGLFRGTF